MKSTSKDNKKQYESNLVQKLSKAGIRGTMSQSNIQKVTAKDLPLTSEWWWDWRYLEGELTSDRIIDRIKQWDQGNCSHGNVYGDTHRHFLVRSDQLTELARIKNFLKVVKPKKSIRTLAGEIFGVLVWVQDEKY